MPDLRIAHVRKRYFVPAWATGDVSRFDRVFASAIRDELLDAALERAGIPASNEICIRRVDSLVQLDRSEPDFRLAAAWSIALADAIASRLRDGGPDVVRYPSRFVALVEIVCAAARGDLERAWAWRSLGMWRAGDAIDVAAAGVEAVAQLAHDARVAPAVLAVAARRGALRLLVPRVPTERWIQLARAALAACAAGEAALVETLPDDSAIRGHAPDAASSFAALAAIARIERTSSILEGIRPLSRARAADPSSTTRALAVLAILECEPALVAVPQAPAIANGLVRTLLSPAIEPAVPSASPRPARDEPEPLAPAPRYGRDRADRDGDPAAADDCVSTTTAFGGLLFLLHLVRALDLPAALLREPVLCARSLPWTLYRLALLLAPAREHDPATLAFAGVSRRAAALVADEPPSNDEENRVLREARAAIVSALRQRMSAAQEETDQELLGRVTSRRAEIVADEGWIEIRLAVADVCTDVRRAGLDLDPGWLPWLGLVVRFAYA